MTFLNVDLGGHTLSEYYKLTFCLSCFAEKSLLYVRLAYNVLVPNQHLPQFYLLKVY